MRVLRSKRVLEGPGWFWRVWEGLEGLGGFGMVQEDPGEFWRFLEGLGGSRRVQESLGRSMRV